MTIFAQFLKQRVHKRIKSCHSNEEIIGRACVRKHSSLDLHNKLSPDIKMKSNFISTKNSVENTEIRNWRYHLTNDHL